MSKLFLVLARCCTLPILCLFVTFFTTQVAVAQINESDTLLFQSRFSLTSAWQTGNVEMLSIRAKLDVSFAPSKKFAFKTQNSYLYQEFFKKRADEDIFSRNFVYLNPQNRVYPFAMAFVSTNFRREIDFRYFAGLGITWQLVRHKNNLLKVALSGIYEKTDFAKTVFNESKYNGNENISTWRATFWLFGKHSILGNKLVFHYDCYAQPSVNQQNNFRGQAEVGFDMPIFRHLSFTTNLIYMYESVVILGQKDTDTILTFGLSYQFKK